MAEGKEEESERTPGNCRTRKESDEEDGSSLLLQSQQNRYGYAHTHTQTKPLGMSASSAENLQSDIFAEQYIPFSLLNFFVSIGAL